MLDGDQQRNGQRRPTDGHFRRMARHRHLPRCRAADQITNFRFGAIRASVSESMSSGRARRPRRVWGARNGVSVTTPHDRSAAEVRAVGGFLVRCETLNLNRAAEHCKLAQPSRAGASRHSGTSLAAPRCDPSADLARPADLGLLPRSQLPSLQAASEVAHAHAREFHNRVKASLELGTIRRRALDRERYLVSCAPFAALRRPSPSFPPSPTSGMLDASFADERLLKADDPGSRHGPGSRTPAAGHRGGLRLDPQVSREPLWEASALRGLRRLAPIVPPGSRSRDATAGGAARLSRPDGRREPPARSRPATPARSRSAAR